MLLVEDNEDDAALIERQLRSAGFGVSSRRTEGALDTRRALENEPWDLVLADFTLPSFRGVDVLPMLRELDLDTPFVIVSGTIDVATALEAMKAGARDFVVKGELNRLPAVVERELESSADLLERRRAERERDMAVVQLRAANEELQALAAENAHRYEAEHRVAEVLQEALLALPKSVTGVEFAARYASAADNARVGGDFYDLFEIEDERIGILIGDVSGKGLEAATLTSIVRNSVRMRAMDGLTPAETMTKTNDAFFALTSSETFVTAFFATLDTRDGTLTYVGAGHPPAMIKRTDGQVGLLGESESLLGAFLGTHFEDHLVLLSPGDVLVAYTDGVIEARDGGALYGQERLRDLLAGLADGTGPEGVAEAVYRDVVEYSGGVTHDDVAILALRRCG